eukprot:496645-Prymnesium_polylepis.1
MTTTATRAYREDLANRHSLQHVMARNPAFRKAIEKQEIEAASIASSPFTLAATITRKATPTRSPLTQALESVDTGAILPPTHPSVQARAKQLNAALQALAVLAPFTDVGDDAMDDTEAAADASSSES